jgi:hypothetical protein
VKSKITGLCLAALGLTAVFAFSAASASAAPLLFVPHSGKFPYHLAGAGGATKLETVSGTAISSTSIDVLALVLSPTLFDARLAFLGSNSFGGKCNNEGNETSETILLNLLGHLGKAHTSTGEVSAVLLLIPTGFEFTCFNTLIGTVSVLVKGSVIGQITKPALNTASEELLLSFKQTSGKQELKSFLLGNALLANQHLESSINHGAFEEAAQAAHATLKALAGQGTFLLITP